MFALWMFGRTLEYELGSRRFLVYYMVCGVGAALIQMAAVWLSGEYYVQLLGASGAVMGLLLAFGVMHPNVPIIFIFLPVPIKAKWFVVIYGVVELFMGWTGLGGNVAHFAHIGGMLWGWACSTGGGNGAKSGSEAMEGYFDTSYGRERAPRRSLIGRMADGVLHRADGRRGRDAAADLCGTPM